MAKPITSQVLLNGSEILTESNYSIKLVHGMVEHHLLEVSCPTEALDDPNSFAQKTKDYVGNKLTLIINEGELTYVGVVTHINIEKFDSADGMLTLYAESPTVLMLHGKDCLSYEKKTLKQIIGEVTKDYPTDILKFDTKPNFSEAIDYTVQYKESDFVFLRRLAYRYGEWFYYDGETVKFGKHKTDEIPLTFGKDLYSFQFGLIAKPQHQKYIAYDSIQAKIHDASTKKESASNPFITSVVSTSEKLFAKKPMANYNHSLLQNGKPELENVLKTKSKSALNTVKFEGKSEEVKASIGNIIDVTDLATEANYGKYLITHITHHINANQEYENEFVAVPSDIEVPAYFDEDAIPYCEEQYAEVKDNNDEKKMGRIKVQFTWQVAENQQSPWLRVVTPYAGSGKGFHVLPEVGEEVLVGFEGGNAEKPFVIGAMFHGKAKSGVENAENKIKSFTTSEGVKIEMNDEEKSITIADGSGSTIKLNGDKTITISAEDKIEIISKEINIKAEKDVTIEADKNMSTKGDSVKVTATKSVSINSSDKIEQSGTKVTIDAKASASMSATKIDISAKAVANIKGTAALNLN